MGVAPASNRSAATPLAVPRRYTLTFVLGPGQPDTSVATRGAVGRSDRRGESVLTAARRAGPTIIASGCHAGGCGVCRIRIISGEVTTERMSRAHITPQDQAEGLTLACRTYATSDLVIMPAGRRQRAARTEPENKPTQHPNQRK